MARETTLLRDQAVRQAFRIPAWVVARMARCNRGTITLFEITPTAVRDESLRARIESIYRDLRELLARYPLERDEAT